MRPIAPILWLALTAAANPVSAGLLGPGVTTNTLPWPGGMIPYAFDASVSPAQQIPYLDGIREWELAAAIQFVPRTTEAQYLLLKFDAFADNTVTGTMPQVMSLNSLTRGQTCHEMGHSLGIEHEFVRPDRDSFLNFIPPLTITYTNTTGIGIGTNIVYFRAVSP